MLTSILTPVVHGDAFGPLRRQWLGLAALHTLGNVAAATAAGGFLTALAWSANELGHLPAPWATWAASAVLLLYVPRTLGWTRLPPLLQSTRQVPRSWAYDYPRWATAVLFGLGLGSGLYTRIVVPTFYVLLLWPFLTPGPWLPVVMWLTYGLVRSGNVWWLAWTAPLDDPFSQAGKLTGALLRRAKWMYRANAVVLVAGAAWLVARSYYQ